MKTPLTITAKVWNYCQNGGGCPYCISGSCLDRWKYRGNFEQLPTNEVLNFDNLLSWVQRYTPKCHIHLSGGEPLLRPDIEDQIEKLISANIQTTVTTNGMFISKRPRLLEMPLKWIVTHHECNDFTEWRRNADLIKEKPHLACRLLYGQANLENCHEIEKHYHGLNFVWARLHTLRVMDWAPNTEDLNQIASDVLHLVEPNGVVYPCNNNSRRSIGNIYKMEYSKTEAQSNNSQCAECIKGGICGSYQTAVFSSRSLSIVK